jgi:hypothetical protein
MDQLTDLEKEQAQEAFKFYRRLVDWNLNCLNATIAERQLSRMELSLIDSAREKLGL